MAKPLARANHTKAVRVCPTGFGRSRLLRSQSGTANTVVHESTDSLLEYRPRIMLLARIQGRHNDEMAFPPIRAHVSHACTYLSFFFHIAKIYHRYPCVFALRWIYNEALLFSFANWRSQLLLLLHDQDKKKKPQNERCIPLFSASPIVYFHSNWLKTTQPLSNQCFITISFILIQICTNIPKTRRFFRSDWIAEHIAVNRLYTNS